MVQLTRLNGHSFAVSCDLIRYIESSPDTVLTLVTGEKVLVRETQDEVIKIAFDYRVNLLRAAWPDATNALVAATVVRANEVAHTVTA